MYHYILLFINKVLYYIRIPFLHVENPFCDFVIVIVWLGIKKPPPASTASPDPSERRGVPMRTREDKDSWLFSQIFFCKILANLSPPPPSGRSGGTSPLLSEGSGEASVYLSVKQTVTKAFAELVTPVPPKTIVFRIKLLTFANREQKPHPTSPKGEEASLQVFCRNYLKKSQEPLSSYVRIGTPPPSGRLGGAPPPREGRSADREIAPKSFRS